MKLAFMILMVRINIFFYEDLSMMLLLYSSDVGIRIACQETSPNFVSVHLAIRNIVELKR